MRFKGAAACWDDFEAFWDSVKQGGSCSRNWYTGNPGSLGAIYGGPTKSFVEPHFTAMTAPALLGFDENIDDYCLEHGDGFGSHAERCIRANVNILSLYGDQIPYNICRNVEWQTCAATGRLPGQGEGRGGNVLRFAKAPRNLQPHKGDRVIGGCYGYHPAGCMLGYSSSDIFFLEACYYDQICSNSHQLWMLEDGQDWICQFDEVGFGELVGWLRVVEQARARVYPAENGTNPGFRPES